MRFCTVRFRDGKLDEKEREERHEDDAAAETGERSEQTGYERSSRDKKSELEMVHRRPAERVCHIGWFRSEARTLTTMGRWISGQRGSALTKKRRFPMSAPQQAAGKCC